MYLTVSFCAICNNIVFMRVMYDICCFYAVVCSYVKFLSSGLSYDKVFLAEVLYGAYGVYI